MILFSLLVLAAQPPPAKVAAERIQPTVIRVTWQDPSHNETSFTIQRKAGRGKFLWVGNFPANTTSFEDKKAKPDFSYGYRVRTSGPGGTSAWSNVGWVSYVPKDGSPTPTTPKDEKWVPAEVSVYALSASSLRVHWKRIPDAKEYRVYRSTESGKYNYAKAQAVVAQKETETIHYDDQGLKEGQEYYYVVRAVLKS
jgi:hypothetical protein